MERNTVGCCSVGSVFVVGIRPLMSTRRVSGFPSLIKIPFQASAEEEFSPSLQEAKLRHISPLNTAAVIRFVFANFIVIITSYYKIYSERTPHATW